MTFFRMELNPVNVVTTKSRSKILSVMRCSDLIGSSIDAHKIGVYKVKAKFILVTSEDRGIMLHWLNDIPPHVGDLQIACRKPQHVCIYPSQSLHCSFFTTV